METEPRIDYRAPGELKAPARATRHHSRKQINKLAESIREFGFRNPIIISSDNEVICGIARLEAARQLGLNRVPVICANDLSAAQIRAYRLADNRIAEDAAWDERNLRIEFEEIIELSGPHEIDLTLTGFETPEIDRLMIEPAAHDPASQSLPAAQDVIAVTRPGDVWHLGPHRLICGDARDRDVLVQLADGEQVRMSFTDPPYNVPVPGHVSGLGRHTHSNFAMACGEMDRDTFIAFLAAAFENMAAIAMDGALHYVCMDWRHIREVIEAGERVFTELKNIVIWRKSNAGMGALYRSQHEMIPVFKQGRAAHVNNIDLGRHGRNRTNVWDYPGCAGFHDGRNEALATHPTVKPVALVLDAIRDCSKRGDNILDPFAGSGTTLIAAERAGRRAMLAEIDPHYADVILARWVAETGHEPYFEETGATRVSLARERASNKAHAAE
ncbi:site-specific DNA-methyltransferase [Parvibaculum sp.]|uniref:site-specific DNA-methyltransferase n=1 Tax=Parvibaculum sp. TaxID=2024848 RepID=UPI00391A24B2